MKYGLSKITVEKIRGVFEAFPEIEMSILYGSRAKGNFKPTSDIDLTLYGDALTPDLRLTIASELDDLLLPYTIDLSIFDELNHAKLQEHIERVGVAFYERRKQGAAMKKGWQTKKLGDVCDFEGGSQPPKSEFIYEDNPGYVRFLQIRDFGSDKNITYIPQSKKNRLCNENDILIGRYGASVGKILTNKAGAYNVALMKTIPNLEVLDQSWFYNYLISDEFQSNLLKVADRSAQAGFSKDDIYNFSVPVPPLPEQQRIVGILDEVLDGIATAKANTEKNLKNARALFESHLQSVFTQRGEGWVEKRLVEISQDFGRGKSKHRPRNDPKLYGGQYPFIQTGDISNADHWLTRYSQTYSEIGLAQSRLWSKGTICIAIVGATVGETAILEFDACFPDSVIGIIVNEQIADNEYVEYLLQSFKALLKEKGKGTARDNINLGTFENQMFPFPSLNLQKEIVISLNALHKETQHLESLYQQKLAALEDLKKSLLHQAFSGAL